MIKNLLLWTGVFLILQPAVMGILHIWGDVEFSPIQWSVAALLALAAASPIAIQLMEEP